MGLAGLIRTIAESEQLEELPAPPGERGKGSLFSWLLSAEDLPLDGPGHAKPRGASPTGLFSSESLPFDEPVASDPRRASFLGTLLATETLPEDLDGASGRGGAHSGR